MNDVSSLSPPDDAAATPASAIALYARHTPGFEQRLAESLALLRAAAAAHPGRIVQATSLGAEDMVLSDLIANAGLPIAIGTLQTGALHAETLALIPAIEQRYGLPVEIYSPRQEAVVHFVRQHGEKAMYQSIELRKSCCQIRKLEPLGRMLEGRSAWITGLRREQSNNRGSVPASEVEPNGRTKFNPLADWSWADIWHYIETRQLPYNALHDEFMPSIGCAPCTRAIAVGEEFRAGRWWWEDEKAKECGLHVRAPAEASDADADAVAA
jgi:phosphoadenosine phosphosulfate reductase